MRSSAAVVAFFVLVGCSSAGDLPLGGPYGGLMPSGTAALDAGLPFLPGTDSGTGVVTPPDTDSGMGIVTPPGIDSGTGIVTPPGSGTGVGTNPGSGSGTGTNPSSGTGTGTNPGSGTGTNPGSGTGSGTGTGPTAPTWTYLYDTYLSDATSTPGDCDGSCHHHSQCSSATKCFSWIGSGQQGSLTGTGGNSLFCWDGSSGGWMPTSGPNSLPQADTDFSAWIAAGSQNN